MKRFLLFVFLGFFCFGLILVSSAWYFLKNTRPAEILVHKIIARTFPAGKVKYAKVSGNLAQGLVFKEVVVTGDSHLPAGTVLNIQELRVAGSFLTILGGERWFHAQINNGRLKLPVSDTILLNGSYTSGQLSLDVYSHGIDLGEIREILGRFQVNSPQYSGRIEDFDVRFEGRIPAISARGKFLLPLFVWERLTAENGQGAINLQIHLAVEPRFDGVIDFTRGDIHGPKTAIVKLKASRMSFKGALISPVFELKGKTKVSGVDIDVALNGTPQQPDLRLTSTPPMAQGQLLAMLVTNKSWQGTEKIFQGQGIPVDLAKDFIDYFALGGMGSELGKQLGIVDFSVSLGMQQRGFDVQKEVTDKVIASYGFEQSLPQTGSPFTTQKIGGQYKVDENMTIGVERSVKQETPSAQTPPKLLDQTIMFKIKKGF